MATVKSRAQAPVGSAQWLLDEQILANDYVSQEVEEFAFSAQNEMEWLNEHMADVFNRNQFDMVEAFKTPGKLKGKTPRTARKRNNPAEDRAPLSDVFTASAQKPLGSPVRKITFSKQVARFQVAEDKDDSHVAEALPSSRISWGTGKENTDSGYFAMTEDEMEVERPIMQSKDAVEGATKPRYALTVPTPRGTQSTRQASPTRETTQPLGRTESQDTFVSAEEGSRPDNLEADNIEAETLESKGFFVEKAGAEISLPRPESKSEESRPSDFNTSKEPEGTVVMTEAVETKDEVAVPPKAIIPDGLAARQSNQYSVSASTAAALDDALQQAEHGSPVHEQIDADDSSPSTDTSSPQRPVVRKKSSLTFASLPAREPLATKKSVGARTSHADQSRMHTLSRDELKGRQTLGKSITDTSASNRFSSNAAPEPNKDEAMVETEATEEASDNISESAKQHNKTSTQRLQERLALLGKTNPPRPSKSIPSNIIASQKRSQQASTGGTEELPKRRSSAREEIEESWIGPMKQQEVHISPQKPVTVGPVAGEAPRPDTDSKIPNLSEDQAMKEPSVAYAAFATDENASSNKKPPTSGSVVSYPQLHPGAEVSKPASDVVRSDGPLSASKAKLFSVFKSAKGIFASSAGVSAQAKLEALSSGTATATTGDDIDSYTRNEAYAALPKASENTKDGSPQKDIAPSEIVAPRHEPADETSRKSSTRSSVRIQNAEEKKRSSKAEDTNKVATDGHDNHSTESTAGEQTRVDGEPVEKQENGIAAVDAHEEASKDQIDMPPPPPPKSHFTGTQMQKGELRRPNRPAKDSATKSRPAPVSIRLASQRVGQIGQPNAPPGSSNQEPLPPAVPPKQPNLSKKASNSSIHTSSSTQSFKTTATSASSRPKALDAAARKKEQDEREAQRKAQQKRDIERRKAAKVEEDRRAAQEQKAAEQRAQEAKHQAQKQAFEQRKADALQRNEQQRNQAAAAARNKAHDDMVSVDPESKSIEDYRLTEKSSTTEPERARAPQNIVRNEASTIRPVSRMGNGQDASRPAPHINPVKPPKRQFNPEDDYSQKPLPGRPGQQDQQAAKRRRTSEDSFIEVVSRPTMAPPVRPSMMRKQENMTKHTQGFLGHGNAQQSSSTSMLKSTINNQHQLQHPKTPHMNDMSKYTNGRIPFAEAPNPPQTGPYSSQPQRLQQPLKTPNSVHNKSSPQYPNGENIDLPEIATDSEDSDDDDFVPPDWANSPALRELLKEQQLVDPMKVFGPIAPLMMEEVFKGNKDRQAKFRNRTSSANWNGPDKLTEEERRKDREARERFERDGGWTFRGQS